MAFNWQTVQLDYVQAFPQVLAEKLIYLKIPVGFKMSKGVPNNYALKVICNIYGQRQAGHVWNKYLVDILVNKLHFK